MDEANKTNQIENQVKFYRGSQYQFDAHLETNTVNPDGIYLVTDTQRLYQGDTLIAQNNILTVEEFPDPENAVPNTVYVVESEDGYCECRILNVEGTDYTTIIDAEMFDMETDDIFTSENIELNIGTNLGGIQDHEVIPGGTSLTELLQKIAVNEVLPTATEPTIKIDVEDKTTYECGSVNNLHITTEFYPGEYTGELKETGIKPTYLFTSTCGKRAQLLRSQYTVGEYDDDYEYEDGENVIEVTASFQKGDSPISNTGVVHDELAIPAGSISANVSIFGARKAFFIADDKSDTPSDSDSVRSLGDSYLDPKKGVPFFVPVHTGDKRIVVAYPKELGELTSICSSSTQFNFVSAFSKTVDLVEGANGYTAVPYNIYTYTCIGELEDDVFVVTI